METISNIYYCFIGEFWDNLFRGDVDLFIKVISVMVIALVAISIIFLSSLIFIFLDGLGKTYYIDGVIIDRAHESSSSNTMFSPLITPTMIIIMPMSLFSEETYSVNVTTEDGVIKVDVDKKFHQTAKTNDPVTVKCSNGIFTKMVYSKSISKK